MCNGGRMRSFGKHGKECKNQKNHDDEDDALQILKHLMKQVRIKYVSGFDIA